MPKLALQTGAFIEPVTKKFREQGFVFAEGDDAVANIPGRKHVEFLAQTSAGAAVVADRDHGAQFADLRMVCLSQSAGPGNVTLEALEQGGKTGAAADGDHAQAAS